MRPNPKRLARLTAIFSLIVMLASTAWASDARYITLASTTSTDNSGLLDELLPKFTAETGIAVRVVTVGTGQAIRLAKNGDADVLLVHHRESEETFVAEGYGVERFPVMHNDFIIVGPSSDPAGVHEMANVTGALSLIAEKQAPFVSRGDDSGTHKKELSLWDAAELDPTAASGSWYRETGSGMGATLNTASAMDAYALADRATWIRFGNKGDLTIQVQGDRRLHNPYGIILVNPDKHAHVKAEDGQRFIDWLVGESGQRAIASFRIEGEQAFFPNSLIE